jgi:hypothetical protein
VNTFDVVARIKSVTSLKVEHRQANCAICHRRGSEIVAIYAPKGESIPLCPGHFEQIEQAVQDRLAELVKK